jgi:hypothetical protein
MLSRLQLEFFDGAAMCFFVRSGAAGKLKKY